MSTLLRATSLKLAREAEREAEGWGVIARHALLGACINASREEEAVSAVLVAFRAARDAQAFREGRLFV